MIMNFYRSLFLTTFTHISDWPKGSEKCDGCNLTSYLSTYWICATCKKIYCLACGYLLFFQLGSRLRNSHLHDPKLEERKQPYDSTI